MKYVIFTEYNDWEGERWRWYIPIEGNEKEIKKLANIIKDSSEYQISSKQVTEELVDELVGNATIGYFHSHNKLKGKLNLGSMNNLDDLLYKGRIRGLME